MKITSVPGEFAHKALVKVLPELPWELTEGYFFNQKEVMEYTISQQKAGYDHFQIIWPAVDDLFMDTKSVYVPTQEELE